VARDRSLSLKIFTALTLEVPRIRTELERRLLGPILERTVGGYPPLAYAGALRSGTLPSNIEVNEFFLQAGRWLSVPRVQQHLRELPDLVYIALHQVQRKPFRRARSDSRQPVQHADQCRDGFRKCGHDSVKSISSRAGEMSLGSLTQSAEQ
jgi:hypothetical protein